MLFCRHPRPQVMAMTVQMGLELDWSIGSLDHLKKYALQ